MNKQAKERVAIAKDALAWIDAGALVPKSMTYVYVSDYARSLQLNNRENLGKQLRDVVLGKCQVCAKGALFLAKAVRYDNVEITSGFNINQLASNHYDGPLTEHFTSDQLVDIEDAFENFRNRDDHPWHVRYPKPKDRLVAILQNIIRNQGNFDLLDYGRP